MAKGKAFIAPCLPAPEYGKSVRFRAAGIIDPISHPDVHTKVPLVHMAIASVSQSVGFCVYNRCLPNKLIE